MPGKKLFLYLFLIWICLLLYLFNNLWLKQNSEGSLWYFSVSHFNDVLAPIVILSIAGIALLLTGRQLLKLWHILLITLACGVFWELGGTLDPADFPFYFAGGLLFWIANKAVNSPLP